MHRIVISYLKWRWFDDTRPLSDLEAIHRASVGLWGSCCLLFSRIRHALLMVAALLVILLAAIGPFTKLAIRSIVCRVQVATSNDVSVPVAHYLNSVDDAHVTADHGPVNFRLGNSMKSAILEALIAKDDGANKLDFSCPTGDCTFKLDPTGSAYSSIGLCKECVDITSLVREWPGQNETTVKGNGLNLTIEGMVSAQNSIATSSPGYWSSITSQESNIEINFGQDSGSQNITYNAQIGTGVLRETPVSQIRMKVNESLFQDPGALLEPCFVDGQPYDRYNISRVPNIPGRNFTTLWTPQSTLQAPAECVYRISYNISQALSQYFRSDFFGNNQCFWDSQNYSNNHSWVACPSEAWWLDSLFNRGFATFDSVDSLLQNMSLAASNQMRAHGTNADWTAPEFASGTMWNSTVCTQVEWGWMAFPAALEVTTLVLLVTVIVMSLRDHGRRPVWKSSTLPLVFHGIRDNKETLGTPGTVVSLADPAIARPIDLAGMDKISKGLPEIEQNTGKEAIG
ncbi:uncharacterized protein LA080_007302 [Diaporthe eres]|nr:uncharacterized protein LA080_007302 [Diaporthe eres]